MIVTVDLALVQSSIRHLNSLLINACATVESTIVQLSIRRLYNCRFDACKKIYFVLF